MPIRRLRQAVERIESFKDGPYAAQVRLLLDTAHAVLAEDDPVKAANRHRTKLAAVHLKSWRPDFGRWSHRYAHGFCLPGKGIVPVKEVMDTLHKAGYDGWIVMEQDHYDVSRELTTLQAAMWMRQEGSRWGIAINPDKKTVEALKPRCRINPLFEALGKSGLEDLIVKALQGKHPVTEILPPELTIQSLAGPLSELFLGRQLSHEVSRDPDPTKFYSTICRTIGRLLGSRCVDIWSFNPLIGDEGGEFHLVGTAAQQLPITQRKSAVSAQQSLAGMCFSYAAIWQFDLRHAIIQTALPHLELLIPLEQQLQALSRMVHELQTPLVAVRGAVDLMQTDLKRKGEDPAAFLRRDFLDDVLQWTELMGRLTLTARVYAQGGADQLRTRRTSTPQTARLAVRFTLSKSRTMAQREDFICLNSTPCTAVRRIRAR